MVVGPLGFLITCHTSWTELSRSLPPGPLTSRQQEKPFPSRQRTGKWPHSRNLFGNIHFTPAKYQWEKNHPPLCYVFSRAKQSAGLPHRAPNQKNEAAMPQFPHLVVSAQLSKEPISHPLPGWGRQRVSASPTEWCLCGWVGTWNAIPCLVDTAVFLFSCLGSASGRPECPASTRLNQAS